MAIVFYGYVETDIYYYRGNDTIIQLNTFAHVMGISGTIFRLPISPKSSLQPYPLIYNYLEAD